MHDKKAERWWERRWYAALLIGLLLIPLAWPPIPPLIDLPGHIGRYHIAAEIARSPDLQQYYSFHWALIGNLGVDLLVQLLQYLLGVELATKVVVLSIPPILGLGLLLCAREVHGRLPATASIALVFSYAHPFVYGFVNYCLAISLAFVAFALWLRLSIRDAIWWRLVAFVPISLVIWLAHAIGWVVLCVLCATSLLTLKTRGMRRVVPALCQTALGCIPLLTPILPAYLQVGLASPGGTYGWFDAVRIMKWAVFLTRDRWMWFDLACTAFIFGILLLALLRRYRLSLDPVLAWPAAALGVLYIVTPQAVGGSVYISSRILPFAVAIALVAIRTGAMTAVKQRIAATVSLAYLTTRLAAVSAGLAIANISYNANLRAVAYIDRGSAVATFAPLPCSPTFASWAPGRTFHLGGIAVARRDAFSNNFWEISGVQLLQIRHTIAGEFRHDPSHTVTLRPCPGNMFRDLPWSIAHFPTAAFDYVWLIDVPIANRPRSNRLSLVYANHVTALYRVKK